MGHFYPVALSVFDNNVFILYTEERLVFGIKILSLTFNLFFLNQRYTLHIEI